MVNAIAQDGFRRFGKALYRFSSSGFGFHSFEDLQQAPTLPVVTLRGKNTFTFEVHIIDEGITAIGGAGHAVEPFLDQPLVHAPCIRQHLRKRAMEAVHQKFGLEIDGAGEERSQFLHRGALRSGVEFDAGIPGAAILRGRHRGQLGSASRGELDKFWETLLEGAAGAFRVPDEVSDSERGKILAGIP